MSGQRTGPDRISETDRRRQQAREALRRQVGIWLSRTIPQAPQHATDGSIRQRR